MIQTNFTNPPLLLGPPLQSGRGEEQIIFTALLQLFFQQPFFLLYVKLVKKTLHQLLDARNKYYTDLNRNILPQTHMHTYMH